MRDFLKSSLRWRRARRFWPLVLMLSLPGCILDAGPYPGSENSQVFEPGLDPLNGAILCDIPKVPDPAVGECAADGDPDLDDAMPLTQAAIALVEGESRLIGLDFSEDARKKCDGNPRKIAYEASFPDGKTVCLNCAQIPAVYLDPLAACVAKCVDLVNAGEHEAPGGPQSFCEQNVKVSTNFIEGCDTTGRCSNGGTPIEPFVDPRREPELVKWGEPQGFGKVFENDVSKILEDGVVDPDPSDWDAGAGSDQIIRGGDAWIEFEAKEKDRSHVLAVSSGDALDTDTSLADVDFALSLNWDNSVYILEDKVDQPDDIIGPLDTYEPGVRFRIRIKDNNNGTATLSAARITGPCTTPTPEMPGTKCPEVQIGAQTKPSLSYPLRIHASFREDDATISNVKLVRIKELP
jgi:hypothetical protein